MVSCIDDHAYYCMYTSMSSTTSILWNLSWRRINKYAVSRDRLSTLRDCLHVRLGFILFPTDYCKLPPKNDHGHDYRFSGREPAWIHCAQHIECSTLLVPADQAPVCASSSRSDTDGTMEWSGLCRMFSRPNCCWTLAVRPFTLGLHYSGSSTKWSTDKFNDWGYHGWKCLRNSDYHLYCCLFLKNRSGYWLGLDWCCTFKQLKVFELLLKSGHRYML